ncbi:hypothetical protein WJX81_002981 [Elliptochloris bilobata]|uniref:Phosphodiesterase n=1 Tax=Elliptochloris bilobata TaxID=381761 RepID=A0AAW1RIY7_9CHLO
MERRSHPVPITADVTRSLDVIRRLQGAPQEVVSASERTALGHLSDWLSDLGVASAGGSSDDEDLVDDAKARSYLHAIRDQYARHSVAPLVHGRLFGQSPKVQPNGVLLRGQVSSKDDLLEAPLATEMEKLDQWEGFDIFEVARLSRGRPLETVTLAALQRFGLVEKLRLPLAKLAAFLQDVEAAYATPNPYHNSTHAADVTQGLATMLAGNAVTAQLTDLELLALVLAAAVHDVGHPGVSNEFLVLTHAEAALTYNDSSVNENMHASLAFRLLRKPANSFLEVLPDNDYRFVRRTMISLVLGTDMALHSEIIKDFAASARLFGGDLGAWPAEKRATLLQMLVHCADIGNPARPLAVSLKWTARIVEEQLAEGDRERALGLPSSAIRDRSRVDVPSSQVAFLAFVVRPAFEAARAVLPAAAATVLANAELARRHWSRCAAHPLDDMFQAPPAVSE